jgi:hypothetical protein
MHSSSQGNLNTTYHILGRKQTTTLSLQTCTIQIHPLKYSSVPSWLIIKFHNSPTHSAVNIFNYCDSIGSRIAVPLSYIAYLLTSYRSFALSLSFSVYYSPTLSIRLAAMQIRHRRVSSLN